MCFALELETAGARGFRERLHTAMEPESGTVERDVLDAERLRLLGNALADGFRRGLVAAVLQILAHVRLGRRRAREHAIALRRDDLRINVAVAAQDDEARRALLRDADARLLRAAAAGFFLRFHGRPYFFLVSLITTRSSE